DCGFTLRVNVAATNATGTASADSAATSVPAAPAPAAGGGGGGGGVPPDLHVDLTSDAATAPPVGSELVYIVKVSMKNLGTSSAVLVDVNLPDGFTVTRTTADRGLGCTGTAPALVCDVA